MFFCAGAPFSRQRMQPTGTGMSVSVCAVAPSVPWGNRSKGVRVSAGVVSVPAPHLFLGVIQGKGVRVALESPLASTNRTFGCVG